jgi:hypothetical protein
MLDNGSLTGELWALQPVADNTSRCFQRLGKCGIVVRMLRGAAPGPGILLMGFDPHSNFRIQSKGDWK